MGEDLQQEVEFLHDLRKKATEQLQGLLTCLFGDCDEEDDVE